MTELRRPRPDLSRDRPVWIAVAAVTTVAALAASLQPPASSIVSEKAATTAVMSTAVMTGASPYPAAPTRPDAASQTLIADFLERMSVAKSAEASLARAFSSNVLRTAVRDPVHLLRVARGATPQACLAQAVYYEARGEPEDGQAAVAQVVLNRTRSGRHPADVCGVVFEGAANPGCQFSFACDPRLVGRRRERAAWSRAEAVASAALQGDGGRPELADVLNYHADSVHPRWAGGLEEAAAIGRHVFYTAKAAASRGWRFEAPAPTAGA